MKLSKLYKQQQEQLISNMVEGINKAVIDFVTSISNTGTIKSIGWHYKRERGIYLTFENKGPAIEECPLSEFKSLIHKDKVYLYDKDRNDVIISGFSKESLKGLQEATSVYVDMDISFGGTPNCFLENELVDKINPPSKNKKNKNKNNNS